MKRLALLGLALLVAQPCGREEEDRPTVAKGELVALKARFAKVKASEDLWRKEIIVIYRVDMVYWFCDLRDVVDYAGPHRLRILLMCGETAFERQVDGESAGPESETAHHRFSDLIA